MSEVDKAERWLPVHGFEGFYEVSDLGRVRSLDREVTNSLGRTTFYPGKVLKPPIDGRGYVTHRLTRVGHGMTTTAHTLVLKAFVGPPGPGMMCCHGDGDRTNNRLDNLRWGTDSDNVRDMLGHGTHCNAAKVECPRGHPYVEGNLVPSHTRKGRRGCLACARAQSRISRHPEWAERRQEISDYYYSQIVGGNCQWPI